MNIHVQVTADSGTYCQQEMETLELRGRTLDEGLLLTLHGPANALVSRLLLHFLPTSSNQSFYLSSLAKNRIRFPQMFSIPSVGET